MIIVSVVVTLVCLGAAYEGFRLGQWRMGILALALPVVCGVFSIRGYSVTPEAILVHRLFWSTRVPLAGLQSAEFKPGVMSGSIRFGNGGFYSITGIYWNKLLGRYRAFVTDLRHTVVLRFTGRTVVVSPAGAEEFVRECRMMNVE